MEEQKTRHDLTSQIAGILAKYVGNEKVVVKEEDKANIPAESTATAFSFFAIPNATANAKINGKFPKIVLPTCDMIVKAHSG